MILQELRAQVIETALQAQSMGLIALTMGNFSLRDRETGYICITPSGLDYQKLEPQDIVVVDEYRHVIEGRRKPSIETAMHCGIYRLRSDVCGIAHTHSTFATAWASTEGELPVMVAEVAALVGDRVLTAPYRAMGSEELAEVVARTLGDRQAVLLANHGLLAVGADLPTAFSSAVMLEEGAKIAFYASLLGRPCLIPGAEAQRLRLWAQEKYGQSK